MNGREDYPFQGEYALSREYLAISDETFGTNALQDRAAHTRACSIGVLAARAIACGVCNAVPAIAVILSHPWANGAVWL